MQRILGPLGMTDTDFCVPPEKRARSAVVYRQDEKTGALINGVAALKASGLDMAQIQKAGATLVQQAEAAAGPDLTNQVLDQVPSLRGHLGL